jgi:hypothetical protein
MFQKVLHAVKEKFSVLFRGWYHIALIMRRCFCSWEVDLLYTLWDRSWSTVKQKTIRPVNRHSVYSKTINTVEITCKPFKTEIDVAEVYLAMCLCIHYSCKGHKKYIPYNYHRTRFFVYPSVYPYVSLSALEGFWWNLLYGRTAYWQEV